jgi:hypothetical protein
MKATEQAVLHTTAEDALKFIGTTKELYPFSGPK